MISLTSSRVGISRWIREYVPAGLPEKTYFPRHASILPRLPLAVRAMPRGVADWQDAFLSGAKACF